MIYFPETINTVSKMNIYITNTFTFISLAEHITHSVHTGILKPWRGRLPHLLVVFSSYHVSRLLSTLVRAQLTLLVPALGIRSPFPQNGAPIHRVRAHSFTGIRNMYIYVVYICIYICICKLPSRVLNVIMGLEWRTESSLHCKKTTYQIPMRTRGLTQKQNVVVVGKFRPPRRSAPNSDGVFLIVCGAMRKVL